MIPFMAGILYNNIENKKDINGSGLLYFWKLLHSSSIQLIPIHQMLLYMHCLDACEADTDNPLLSSQLQVCHKTLIQSFESWIISWINFDDKNYNYTQSYRCILDKILNKIIGLHLSNFQYIIYHPDIHLCIIDQIKNQTKIDLNYYKINDRLDILEYLCISAETLDIIIECYKKNKWLYEKLICKIIMKLNEKQLNDVFESFMEKFNNEDKYLYWISMESLTQITLYLNEQQLNKILIFIMDRFNDEYNHKDCIKTLTEMALHLNERELNIIFNFLMDIFENKKIEICLECAHILAIISLQLGIKQINNVFQYLKKKFSSYLYDIRAIPFLIKLTEEQLGDFFKCLVIRLTNEKEYLYIHNNCAQLLGSLSIKWNERQLNSAPNFLIKIINNKNKDNTLREICIRSLGTIAIKLNGEQQLNDIFQCLLNGLKDNPWNIQQLYIKTLSTLLILKKWNEKQLNIIFQCLMDGFQFKNGYDCYNSRDLVREISIILNVTQIDTLFTFLINGLKYNDKYIYRCCIESIGYLSKKLNEKYLSDAFQYLINGLKNNQDVNIRKSCAKSLGLISAQLNEKQLNNVFDILMSTSKSLIDIFNSLKEDKEYMQTLQKICTRLNDKQLYLFVKHLLERAKRRFIDYIHDILLKISDDMWKRVTIVILKEYIQQNKITENDEKLINEDNNNLKKENTNDNIDMKLLAYGLLLFNPRIQLNYNDNITLDALNELINYCDKQAIEWGFPTNQQFKWNHNDEDISYPYLNNEILFNDENIYKGNYNSLHETALLGDLSQLKLVLQDNPYIDINDSCNEYQQTLLHLSITNNYWDIARYCIEKGAWIDVRENAINSSTLQTPFENLIQFMKKNSDNKECSEIIKMCKWILRKRTIYPIKRIEHAIDYVKDKLIDENGIIKIIDEKNYSTLLQEGAIFLLGINQKELQDNLIKNDLLYPISFLINRIFFLFEICVNLRQEEEEEENKIKLPINTTFEQIYEKGVKELQVQLTTYWDYITIEECKHKYPDFIDDWSYNIVDRLMNLKSISLNSYYEMSLIIDHKDYCIHLSLCKTLDSILVRIDNRLMKIVPFNISHPKNELGLIQPYLVAYFSLNDSNIDQNKEWLKKYIKNAIQLKDMNHLYCNDNNTLSPREGNVSSIINHWPYFSIQTDSNNSYLKNSNIGYRIRVGDINYEWFRNQETKSFVFKNHK
ncbi:hypothetical protein RFI_29989 [Reticulomyxa filosa]|uniref:Uncharacterized protein n=1 Tax=Reticulomyxa filosa TaxID=46433 RepID=X6M1E3_RETFI|nr:hypothetical protein RFI_29989 [Reticulomyxa filosa]|eukprot:ETO07401.1 hypothetical protein RFI_29989 [Reticulomyxa filosa]